MTALPRPSSRLDSVAFTEDVCAYLGAPIPACVAVRNTIVPQARGHDRRVGDYGGPLLSAQMDGLWDRSHRGLQRLVAADVRDHGGAASDGRCAGSVTLAFSRRCNYNGHCIVITLP